MKNYRKLTKEEIANLKEHNCTADSWDNILVTEGCDTKYITNTRFSGVVKIGRFDDEFLLAGGVRKHSGISFASLHNVEIGDNCCIENIKNYIANYKVGDNCFIENVDIILVDRPSSFGNGVEVEVMNECGGREVMIHSRLSAHQAYIMALYRHRPLLIENMRRIISKYAEEMTSTVGEIGSNVTIVDAGYIKNVYVGDYCEIEGASRLKNGSLNSNKEAPIHIGCGVICDDFIISSGSSVEDGTTLEKCFVGQSCKLGHGYSASNSLFFSNCQEENGEACAVFAGPFTVTHHKSTLLIAGMFSFMNAGSGSNQSNHLYKLGPIHNGVIERGAKTTSGSYILWPARIGAFSLIMGRHVSHPDTTDLPFSYLIEQENTTYLVPGVNLRSVGTIRDVRKWPRRDKRTDNDKLDQINFNLLSPYTISKMIRGCRLLEELRRISGEMSETYSFQSAKIKNSSLQNGLMYYNMAIEKFLGNSLIKRLENTKFKSIEEVREQLKPKTRIGVGKWIDLSGLIAPQDEIERLIKSIEKGETTSIDEIHNFFVKLHTNYYENEWTWAYEEIMNYYKLKIENITVRDIKNIVKRWTQAVVNLDKLVYEDARKEYSLSAMTGFGADGSQEERKQDFEQVRGVFESNPFVMSVLEHIEKKTKLGEELLSRLEELTPNNQKNK